MSTDINPVRGACVVAGAEVDAGDASRRALREPASASASATSSSSSGRRRRECARH
jgi:hypothetical protein